MKPIMSKSALREEIARLREELGESNEKAASHVIEIARLREELNAWKGIADGRAKLLVCYRIGAAALTKIEKGERRLAKLNAQPDAGGEG